MSASDGRVVGSAKVVDNGPDGSRWNLVIVGDGYRESELLIPYRDHVQRFIAVLSATPPFTELFRGINVHRVDVASDESGADDPASCVGGTGATARTFFDATFCSGGLDRLLTINSSLARSVATERVPFRHQVLCIVNSTKYGGSGGGVGSLIATCSVNPSSADIAIHEIGHSAFGLADEYGGSSPAPTVEPPNPNVTRDPSRATIKWRTLVNASTPMPSQCASGCTASTCVPPTTPPPAGAVGAYEGGFYSNCNTYRPLPNCRMRNLSAPFCPVCAGVIRQTLRPFQPVG
jgi:hypothetical protein